MLNQNGKTKMAILHSVLKFVIGSDDDALTSSAIAALPASTLPTTVAAFTDSYYQAAYDLGYTTFADLDDETVYLVK